MTLKPGINLTKQASGRQAQVSAITSTHSILYWSDTDQQTSVKLERFGRTNEWAPASGQDT